MAFEGLSERLQRTLKNISGKGKISDNDLNDSMKEIKLALLEADVNLDVVKEFTNNVKVKAQGHAVVDSVTPAQQIIKIVNDELQATLGQTQVPLNKNEQGNPTVVMMTGLQGTGKTTTAGKLSKLLKDRQKANPLLIAADVYRPAAIDQLKTIGDQLDIPVFEMGTDVAPQEIVKQGLAYGKANNYDYIIIDTAGRLEIDESLMQELMDIKQLANPDEILLVIDSMTGQSAVAVAEGFDRKLDVTGLIMTKLDGDTRGGAALSVTAVTKKPIKYIGEGEKLTDLEIFYPDRMSNRILGMGDVVSLVEKAERIYDEQQAKDVAQKMRENTFDFDDFIEQMNQMSKLGSMKDILKMIPGIDSKMLNQVNISDEDMGRMKAIVYSMTPYERQNSDAINPSRRRRIADGSGRPLLEVNQLIKRFNQSKDMMKKMANGNMGDMASMMGGMPGMGGAMGSMMMKHAVNKQKKIKKSKLKKARRFKS